MKKTSFKQSITKLATAIAVSVILLAPLQSYAALSALFYTNSFDAEVGDSVTFDLKINPSSTVYTVGATLNYDPEMLTFVSATFDKNWLGLSRVPYELTDTSNGVIQRTAGFPEGTATVMPFIKYKFKAKKVGDTKVIIAEGLSLDANNNDTGLQKKEITVKIAGAKKATVNNENIKVISDTKVIVKNIELTLTLSGATAVTTGNDYKLSAVLNAKDGKGKDITEMQNMSGSTTVYLIDKTGNSLYSDTKSFISINPTQNIDFNIPKEVLAQGDYDIMTEVKYDNQKTPLVVNKPIGVLNRQVDTKEIEKIPDYMWPMIVSLIVLLIVSSISIYVIKHSSSKKRK